MEPPSRSRATNLVYVVTKRLALTLLPLGFSLGDFIGAAKSAFVDAATDQIRRRGERASAARIAVLTGLTRTEVAKVQRQIAAVSSPFTAQRTERVMHGWFTDAKYVDGAGRPRSLQMTGIGSFTQLVREYSGDIPPKAVLSELIAGGMAEETPSGTIKAFRRYYLLATGRPAPDLDLLTTDTDIFLRGALSQDDVGESAMKRVSVAFRDGVPLSVRRTVMLRIDRFLEAMADYLQSHAMTFSGEHKAGREERMPTIHVMVTQSEGFDSK